VLPEDALYSSSFCKIIVTHGVSVSADEVDIGWGQFGSSQSERHSSCDRLTGFVHLTQVRALASTREAENSGIDTRAARPRGFFVLDHNDGGALRKDQP
jgi:hypothetical protein